MRNVGYNARGYDFPYGLDHYFYERLAMTLGERIAWKSDERVTSIRKKDSPDDYLEWRLGRLAATIEEYLQKHNLKLLMLLDEFDYTVVGLESRQQRSLMKSLHRFRLSDNMRLGIASYRSVEALSYRDPLWAAELGQAVIDYRIGLLPLKDAEILIRQPFADNGVDWDDEAVDRLLTATAGYPLFIHTICRSLYIDFVEKGNNSGVVRLEHVSRAIYEVITSYRHSVHWKQLLFPERMDSLKRAVIAIIALAPEHTIRQRNDNKTRMVTVSYIAQRIDSLGLGISETAVNVATNDLVEMQMLDLELLGEVGWVWLTIPILGEYFVRRRSWEQVVEDLTSGETRIDIEDLGQQMGRSIDG